MKPDRSGIYELISFWNCMCMNPLRRCTLTMLATYNMIYCLAMYSYNYAPFPPMLAHVTVITINCWLIL